MNEPVQLHLVELMQADQAAGVPAIAARFTTETGAVGGVAQGQLIRGNDFVPMQGCDRHLRCGGEPEVVLRAAKALLGEFGQLAGARQAGAVDQNRGQHLPIPLAGVQIQHEIDQSPLQAGPLPHQGDEAALGNPHRAFGVEQLKTLGDLPVLLKTVLLAWRPPAPHLHVVVFTRSIRTVLGGKVGEGEQLLLQLCAELLLLVLQDRDLLLDRITLLPQFSDVVALGIGT